MAGAGFSIGISKHDSGFSLGRYKLKALLFHPCNFSAQC